MKKLLVLALLLISSNVYAVDEWTVAKPAVGDNLTAFPADNQANNGAMNRLLSKYQRGQQITFKDANTVTVTAGEIVCSDGSTNKFRVNTSGTDVTFSNIDTGAEASATTYYVYANCDAAATTNTFKVSLSSTTPTGVTSFRRLGSFYNDASSNISRLVNDNYQGAGTAVSKSFETAYLALTDGFVFGYASGGAANCTMTAYSDSASAPATVVQMGSFTFVGGGPNAYVPVSFFVNKGDYYKVTNSTAGGGALYFKPSGI